MTIITITQLEQIGTLLTDKEDFHTIILSDKEEIEFSKMWGCDKDEEWKVQYFRKGELCMEEEYRNLEEAIKDTKEFLEEELKDGTTYS